MGFLVHPGTVRWWAAAAGRCGQASWLHWAGMGSIGRNSIAKYFSHLVWCNPGSLAESCRSRTDFCLSTALAQTDTYMSHQTSLLSLWCDIDIIKDPLLPTQGRTHPSPHCWTTAAGASLLQCTISQLIPYCCSRLISPDHVILAAGFFASAILGCSPQGLKAKSPSKRLQHQDPIGEEGWEVLLNRKYDEQVPVVKISKFPAQPTEIENYFQLKKKKPTKELLVSLVQGD